MFPRTTFLRLSNSLSSIARFSSFSVGVDGGFADDMGYTMAISGKMKWALFKGFVSSLSVAFGWVCVGKNLVIRENRVCCWGGGRFKMDFPGTGMVTADDEGGHDDPEDEDAAIS